MRRALTVILCTAACNGSSPPSSDASTDAAMMDGGGAGDAAPGSIALVQSAANSNSAGTLSVTIAPTGTGNLIVVGITQETTATATVAGIVDNAPGGGNTYTSTNERAVDSTCDSTSEIWYAKNAVAGATFVRVTMSGTVAFEMWVAEFAGLSTASPFDVGAVGSSATTTATLTSPPVTVSAPPELVVSAASTCGAIQNLHTGSPFTALTIQNGEDTAYAVAATSGSYGAVWDYSAGSWIASTAAFR